jgi:phospholipid/cholesterol/gamma-HCH transport system permease protein
MIRRVPADGTETREPLRMFRAGKGLSQQRIAAMPSTSTAATTPILLAPVVGVGRSVLAMFGYVGGVTLMATAALGSALTLWPSRNQAPAPGFFKTLVHELYWMLYTGLPLVALVHFALGSFLSLQAYYGSTFVDGTGAVVGVGLLRNMGGMMTGLTFSGILAARLVPELRILSRFLASEAAASAGGETVDRRGRDRNLVEDDDRPRTIAPGRLAAPRIAAAAIACLLLSQWGIAIGTAVGWQASQSMMGVSTSTFFMMMMKMMWFRDVVGLVAKGLIFGAIPATICCFEGLVNATVDDEPVSDGISPLYPAHGLAPPWYKPVFRATCLSSVAILFLNSSWFMLVYHAVPFYGPTLLAPPGR